MSTAALATWTWDDPWLTRATTWITGVVEERGTRLIGPIERAHVRPWSSVLSVPTAEGTWWFKANGPGAVHEAPLVRTLHALTAGRVPDPVAVAESTGWFLLRSAGDPLTAAPTLEADLARWETIVGEYAALQRDLVPHAEELTAVGAPDLRPEKAPDTFDALLDDPAALWLDQPAGLTREEYDGLLALRLDVRDWCDELAGLGIPATVQHDDLHAGNVFRGPGGYVFIDWADACVSHPFGSLLHPERELTSRWGLSPGAPELERLRAAYVAPWSCTYDPATLRRARRLALLVTCVVRALAWRRALDGVERAALKEYYATPESRWLRKLLHAAPLS
ncbi:phosphotransferase family protein [Streptomyces massasporeus]|uniref:phosphotransferase family protein n=1 Tax=Streptomyces massasporeus TaxID=67324 RepID=UPI00364A2AA8